MHLPFIWPENDVAGDSGRLTEIASFRKSNIPSDRFSAVLSDCMNKMSEFPIARQSLVGQQLEDPEIFVLVADWTSAEEKDEFEPGERYQSIKPAFGELVNSERTNFQCHHIILPNASKTTPSADFYVVSTMRVATEHHQLIASAFDKYSKTLETEDGYIFLVVAPSREDPEVLVCFTGFRGEEYAERAGQATTHDALKLELDKYVINGSKYGAILKNSSDIDNSM